MAVRQDDVTEERLVSTRSPAGETEAPHWNCGPSLAVWLVAVTAPVFLFVVLGPERYGITPNSLDPVFYTGYSMNFDDVLNAAGDAHYFVSRWSAYLPMYALDRLAGPFVGRLLWRWALAALIVVAIGKLGRRLNWRVSHQVLGAVLVLSMPMFLRAFLTDYVEYMVVGLGVCLVTGALRERQTMLSAAGFGATGAAMIVANPVSLILVAMCAVTAVLTMRVSWVRRLGFAAWAGAVALAVIGGGLLLFRWRYDIPNVYQPTIDFIRTYPGDPDAWRSPRLDWMGRYLWIYVPIVVAGMAVIAMTVQRVRWTRLEAAGLLLAATFYAYQWFDQFAREGYSLEISFYWSYGLPTLLVATIIVVNRMLASSSDRWVFGVAVGWLILLVSTLPDRLRLPAGLGFVVVTVIVAAAVVVATRRIVAIAVLGVLGLVAWMQIGAPSYDPSSYFSLNTSPRYDLVIRSAGSESDDILEQVVWFADRMDTVANDASTSFLSVGGWSSSITAIYAPHVTGRIMYPTSNNQLTDLNVSEIASGFRPIVAVFGDPNAVSLVASDMLERVGDGTLVLDEQGGPLDYRLMVYDMPDATRLPFTWPAAVLPRVTGSPVEGSVVAAAGIQPGFVTFGPYLELPEGRYVATLRYRTQAAPEDVVGSFDVTSADGTPAGIVGLTGSGSRAVEVPFEVRSGDERWEFRTTTTGIASVEFVSISLAPAP